MKAYEKKIPKFKSEDKERDISYQSLMKMFLAERIEHELKSASR